jgi:hypothetical protein
MQCASARSFVPSNGWRSTSVTHRQFVAAATSHPEIFEGFLDGTPLATLAEKTRVYLAEEIESMNAEEAAVAAFLRLRLAELADKAVA